MKSVTAVKILLLSGQNEPNLALWLATRASKISRKLGITRFVTQPSWLHALSKVHPLFPKFSNRFDSGSKLLTLFLTFWFLPIHSAHCRLQNSLYQACYVITLCQALVLCVYCTLVFGQRYHLFVWSVFSPKLLYEASRTFLLSVFVVCVLCLMTFVVGRKGRDAEKSE